jgi:hypothetical protein
VALLRISGGPSGHDREAVQGLPVSAPGGGEGVPRRAPAAVPRGGYRSGGGADARGAAGREAPAVGEPRNLVVEQATIRLAQERVAQLLRERGIAHKVNSAVRAELVTRLRQAIDQAVQESIENIEQELDPL